MSAADAGHARPTFGVARLAEETRERFLREVLTRVPLARLVELHLFAPIRQGGIESGVAVLAATPAPAELPPDVTVDAPAEVPQAEATPDAVADAAVEDGLRPSPADDVPDADPTEAAAGDAPDEATDDEPAAEPAAEAVPQTLPQEVHEVSSDREPASTAPHAPPRRHTVFTARYRLLLKGPDRGKWDVEVREEADAPLVTVEAVVRGVQQRSGDAADPERFDAHAIARALGLPLPGSA
ncbi:hypothetical protein [Roseisolibacter sp. H3M3-2]|uniref:hypothetical protein n=1 Tax=Roseisolibacter sp. H3M3-2 TaxID=3031323 RepID=UPI0023DAF961|nr:hypothetical protein [Roseisolibacter sp. H3M3-2]MDF1502144.1 hypothetical protein [Roseisolibacter sp. H3M3-2]